MPRGVNPAMVAQAKVNRDASNKFGGDVTVKRTAQGKIYKPNIPAAIGKGIGKSITDVASLPLRAAIKVTEPVSQAQKPSLAGRMNSLIGGAVAGGVAGKLSPSAGTGIARAFGRR